MAKAESENAKVGVRAARKSAMDELKRMGSDGLSEDLRKDNENNIQKMTDDYIAKCDAMFAKKENDIMTV
jgi:ribosome recycling factor